MWGIALRRALFLQAGQFRGPLGRTSRGTAVLEAKGVPPLGIPVACVFSSVRSEA